MKGEHKMNSIFKNIIQDMEFNYEYSSASISLAESVTSDFVEFPTFYFHRNEPKYILRELSCIPEESDHSWFMETDWIKGEIEADEDIQEGRYLKFEDAKKAMSSLAAHR